MSEPAEPTLFCPTCRYNLTGLPENRCPECGGTFDPDELRRIASDEACRVLGEPGVPPGRRAWKLWWTPLFSPRQFARRFPARHAVGPAIAYSFACYALAMSAFVALTEALWFGTGAGQFPSELIAAVVCGSAFACWLCETAIAVVCASLLPPTGARVGYHFWRGLTHYTGGFTLFTGVWGGWATICFDFAAQPNLARSGMAFMATGIFIWWAITLDIMIVERSRAGFSRWAICVLVPLIGVGAIWVGVMATAITAILFMPF